MKPFLFCILLLSLCRCAWANKEITWYSYHQPPATIYQGPHKGQGYVDQLVALLIKALPDYDHHLMQVTLGRIKQDMKMGRKVCFPAMARTPEREQYALFSHNFMMQPSLRVLIKKDQSLPFQSQAVSLENMFSTHGLTMGRVAGRSYGQSIDPTLSRYNNQIISRVDKSNLGLFRMLDKGRIDFILSYPHEAGYALSGINSQTQYTSLAIEGLPAFTKGGIGCSRNNWRHQVIEDINQALLVLRQQPTYLKTMTQWLDQQVVTPDYYQFYQQHFINDKSE